MRDEILKRDMFAMPLSSKSKNTGIMQGFDDMEQVAVEEMPPMARVPQNPEILMNNLRGDIRSVDARYMELAQMVGEQAAMETPPEVLAMLQTQMAQPPMPPVGAAPEQPPQMDMPQQGGIGALPQAAGMMPPGMEGAPPFPAGPSEAPPTPDGLPPERASIGKFITTAGRYGSDIAEGARTIGRNVYEAGTDAVRAADRFLGDTFARPYMDVVPMRGPDGGRLVGLGRENIRMSQPNILEPQTPVPGTGTRFEALNTMGLRNPTFSEAFQASARMNPKQFIAGSSLAIAPFQAELLNEIGNRLSKTADKRSGAESQVDLIPGQGPPLTDPMGRPYRLGEAMMPANETINKIMREPSPIDTKPVMAPEQKPEESVIQEKPVADDTSKFIKEKLAEPAAKTKAQRIKEEYEGLQPMFAEILGSNKDDMRMNALLLLSDAGFKLASTYKPTFGMAFADALSGLPKGLAALAAQSKQNGIQLKTAALQQAVNNINLQDKYAMDMQLANTRGMYDIKKTVLKGDFEVQKAIAQEGGTIIEDAGMGLRNEKRKNGSFIRSFIPYDEKTGKPTDPTVISAIESNFTLRPTDSPFVEWRGKAPTTVETDKAERIKLGNTLRSLDGSLQTLQNLKGQYAGAYSPGTWFTDKVNNIFVPISGGLIRPDVSQQDVATRISVGMNQIMKSIASANDSGRVAVQEQEWARETAKGINDPTAFFANKELAAKQFNSMDTMIRNARQNVLTQLGYIDQDYVMSTPSTGTQNDPFVISADPAEQKRMFTYLGSTIGMVQDPKATVYIRMPNGRVDAFNPTQLRNLIQK
jgi:hypothetical protein